MSEFNDKDKELMTQLQVLVGGSVVVGFLLLASKGMEWSYNAYDNVKAEEAATQESEKQQLIENNRRDIHFHSLQIVPAQDMPQHDDPRKLYDLLITASIDAPPGSPLLMESMSAAGMIVKREVLADYQVMGVVDVHMGDYKLDTGETDITLRARIEGELPAIERNIDKHFSKLQQKQAGEGMMLPEEPAPAIAPQDTAITGGKGPTPAR